MTTNTGVVNIRGKEYQTVALRVAKFREQHPDWSITTELLHCDDVLVRMKATISSSVFVDPNKALAMQPLPAVIATGHAEEYRTASQINHTSAVENCETSAIGRALAAAGFGGTEFATADELDKAMRTRDAQIGMSAAQVAKDALSALPPDDQRFVSREADKILAFFSDGDEDTAARLADVHCRAAFYDNETKLALWALLPSNVRAALKRKITEHGPYPIPVTELASQP